jgi:hypothetical protein
VTRRTAPRIAWLGAAAILDVAALVALAAVLRGDFSDTDFGETLGILDLPSGHAASHVLAELGGKVAVRQHEIVPRL